MKRLNSIMKKKTKQDEIIELLKENNRLLVTLIETQITRESFKSAFTMKGDDLVLAINRSNGGQQRQS